MSIRSIWSHARCRVGLKIDKARILFRTTATAPRSRFAALILKSNWSFPRNLWFSAVLLVLAIAFCIVSWQLAAPQPAMPYPTVKMWLTVALFVVLLCEALSIILSLGWFLLCHISMAGMQHADMLFSSLSKTEREDCISRFAKAIAADDKKAAQSCVDQVLSNYCLAAHLIGRFAYFAGVWFRVWIGFTAGSVTLSMLQKIAAHPVPVFGIATYELTMKGVASLVEQSLYHNLVTISTVGYGDFAPATLAGRILVVWQILTTLAVLTFGVNILVGLILESSALAWAGRRDIVWEFLNRASAQH